MARRIIGITGVSLWAGLVAAAVLSGFQATVNGQEEIFKNLPAGWQVVKSFAVPQSERMAFSRKLGARISKLSNTFLSVNGRSLQVNVVHCMTARGADKVYKAILDAHGGLAVSVAQLGNMVVEFAKCDDIELMKKARRVLGLETVRLDDVAAKLIRKVPAGWQIEDSFLVPPDQTSAIEKKLGGQIKNLSNTIFSVRGKRLQVNIIECTTPDEAAKIHQSILAMKADPAFCRRYDNWVVEFVGDDLELAKKAVYELGLEPEPVSEYDQLESLAKDLVNLLVKQDYTKAAENFDVAMKTALPPHKLQEVWASIINQSGSFVEQLGVRKEKVLNYDVVFVTCKFTRAVLDAKVVFDNKKQITGLFFIPGQHPSENQPPHHIANGKDILGLWLGTLKSFGVEIQIVFKISKKADGGLAAAMDIPLQRAENMPVDKVTFENGSLRLEMKSMMAAFEGKMQKGSLAIDGQWQQGGQAVPLTLKRVDAVPALRRPQEPKKPYPYDEQEVVYENSKAGIKLAGTLTLPRSRGPFPAVLLISGSGAQDRNETVFGHRPFLVLADYLTRQGLAVLRVDDRGIGGSTGSIALFLQSTSEDFAGDVLAGIDYLKSRSEIDPKKIGLIGHSEGGIIAPMAAAQSPDVAFVVLMAGTGLTGEQTLYLQNDLLLKTVGASNEVLAIRRAALTQMFDILKHDKDNAAAETKIRRLLKDSSAKMSEQEKEAVGASEGMLELQIKMALSPWFRFFLTYDPKLTLMKVKCPVLAIVGEKDLQVAPEQNLRAIEEALKAGGNEHYTVKQLPSLNHLFQTAQTGALAEYAKIEETISPHALKLIGDWINKL